MNARTDGLRPSHRHCAGSQSGSGLRLEHRRREGSAHNLLDDELRPCQSQANDVADAEGMTTARLQLSRADEGPISAAGILDVPFAVIEEESGVATGDGLGGVAFDKDGGGGITAD